MKLLKKTALLALALYAVTSEVYADGDDEDDTDHDDDDHDDDHHDDHHFRWCCREGKEYNGETEYERCEKMVPILNKISMEQEEEEHQVEFECVVSTNCTTPALMHDEEEHSEHDYDYIDEDEHHSEVSRWCENR